MARSKLPYSERRHVLSVRLPRATIKAARQHAEENDATVTDVVEQGIDALIYGPGVDKKEPTP